MLSPSHVVLPFRRAPIDLRPGAIETLHIRPVYRGGVALTIKGDVPLPNPEIHYESVGTTNDDVLVRYRLKEITDDKVEYRGPNLMISCGFVSIYGRSAIYLPKLGEVRLKGQDLELEDGNQFWRPESIEIRLATLRVRFVVGGVSRQLSLRAGEEPARPR